MKSRTQQPMEKYMERYGKGENSVLCQTLLRLYPTPYTQIFWNADIQRD